MSRPAAYRRRLLLNTAAHGLSAIWLTALTLATLPALLHGLGAEAFGIWVLIQTFSATSGWLSLADLGIGGAVTRSVAGHASTDQHRQHLVVLSSGLVLLAGIGAAASILLGLIGPHVLPDLFGVPAPLHDAAVTAIVVFSAQVFVEFVSGAVLAGLEGAQRVDLSRLVTVVTRTAQLGSTAVIALSGGGLLAVAVGSFVATGAGTVLGIVLLVLRLPGRPAAPELGEIRALVAYGLAIAGLNASGVLHRTMDRIVVGAILGPSSVTLVEIATQVQGGASAVLASTTYVTLSASPWVAARDEPGKLRELLVRGTKYSILATLPCVLGASLLAGPMVQVWVGASFAGAAGLIALAVAYVGLATLVTVGALMLEGTGHARRVLGPSLATTAINLLASVLLVQRYGVAGAFVATIVGMVLFVPAILWRTFQTYGLGLRTFLRQSVLPAGWPAAAQVGATGAIVALSFSAWPTLLLGAGLGLAAFVAVAWRWSFGQEERAELRSVLHREPASGG